MSPEEMAKAPWDTLIQARQALPPDDPQQVQIAPYEHRAFARERVAENPLQALTFAAAIPGYQLVKMVKSFGTGQTPPSMDQFTHGMTGIAEGVQQWLANRRQSP